MDKKVTTLVALGSTIALLNYLGKVNEEESLKMILAMVCALYVSSQQIYKVLYTREITFYNSMSSKVSFVFTVKDGCLSPFGFEEAILSGK